MPAPGLTRTPNFARTPGGVYGVPGLPAMPSGVPQAPAAAPPPSGIVSSFAPMPPRDPSGAPPRRYTPRQRPQVSLGAMPQGDLAQAVYAAVTPHVGGSGVPRPTNIQPWFIRDLLSGGTSSPVFQNIWSNMFSGQPNDLRNWLGQWYSGDPRQTRIGIARSEGQFNPTSQEEMLQYILSQLDRWYKYGIPGPSATQAQQRQTGNYATQIGPG